MQTKSMFYIYLADKRTKNSAIQKLVNVVGVNGPKLMKRIGNSTAGADT